MSTPNEIQGELYNLIWFGFRRSRTLSELGGFEMYIIRDNNQLQSFSMTTYYTNNPLPSHNESRNAALWIHIFFEIRKTVRFCNEELFCVRFFAYLNLTLRETGVALAVICSLTVGNLCLQSLPTNLSFYDLLCLIFLSRFYDYWFGNSCYRYIGL